MLCDSNQFRAPIVRQGLRGDVLLNTHCPPQPFFYRYIKGLLCVFPFKITSYQSCMRSRRPLCDNTTELQKSINREAPIEYSWQYEWAKYHIYLSDYFGSYHNINRLLKTALKYRDNLQQIKYGLILFKGFLDPRFELLPNILIDTEMCRHSF